MSRVELIRPMLRLQTKLSRDSCVLLPPTSIQRSQSSPPLYLVIQSHKKTRTMMLTMTFLLLFSLLFRLVFIYLFILLLLRNLDSRTKRKKQTNEWVTFWAMNLTIMYFLGALWSDLGDESLQHISCPSMP